MTDSAAPSRAFAFPEYEGEVTAGYDSPELEEQARRASLNCPEDAITLVEDEGGGAA